MSIPFSKRFQIKISIENGESGKYEYSVSRY